MGKGRSSMLSFVFASLFLLTIKTTQGLRCLRCTDVIDPRHCHTITFCNDFEECFVERFAIESGENLYNVGCKATKICQQHRTLDLQQRLHELKTDRQPRILCSQCCTDGDLCNAKGCGASGYPVNYGPTCLHCLQIKNPESCDVITTCNSDEHCFIQELREFGDVYYKTKCLPSHECTLTDITGSLIGKRDVHEVHGRSVSCAACCDFTLCNSQCPINPMTSAATTKAPTLTTTTTETTTTTTPTTTSTTTSTTTPKAQENEYVILFLKNYEGSNILNDVIISGRKEFPVYIETSYNNQTEALQSSQGIVHLNYTNEFTANENVVENKGVYIKSDAEMYVDVISNFTSVCCTVDGYRAISVKSLGTEYMVVTLKQYNSYDKNEIGFVAVYDNTSISINLQISSPITVNGKEYHDGDTLNLKLNRLQSFQLVYLQTNEALTNMKVKGNKPFAMFSGNQCGNINRYGCTYMVESIPPISGIGNTYIIPHVQHAFKEPAYIKITPVNNTDISVIGQTGPLKTIPGHDSVLDPINVENMTVVHGNSQFLLTLYVSLKVHGVYGMINIPSICHYSNQYIITAPSTLNFNNYISIIIEYQYRHGLLLDGIPLNTNNSKTILYSGKTWISISTVISDGRHDLKHQDKAVTFGVIQYGYRDTDPNYNYGFAIINDLTTKSSYCP